MGDDTTVTILNRLVTWVCLSGSRNQIEIEADPRHRQSDDSNDGDARVDAAEAHED